MKKSFIIAATALTLLSTGITSVATSSNITISASSKKNKEINKDLAKNLKQDQSYADEDEDNFGYAKYIEKMEYSDPADLNIHVNGAFKSLSNDEKTDVLNKAQGLAKMVLTQDDESNSDITKGFITEVFNGKNSIAVSKVSNRKAYHFN